MHALILLRGPGTGNGPRARAPDRASAAPGALGAPGHRPRRIRTASCTGGGVGGGGGGYLLHMPDAHDQRGGRIERSDRLIARSNEEEATARQYLEDRRPDIPPIGEVPAVEHRIVHEEPPPLQPEGSSACGAVARMRDEPITGGSYMDQRYPVQCLRPPRHDGPHVTKSRWEAPRTWSVWAWD